MAGLKHNTFIRLIKSQSFTREKMWRGQSGGTIFAASLFPLSMRYTSTEYLKMNRGLQTEVMSKSVSLAEGKIGNRGLEE